jgi:hypothetical protein
MRWSRPRRRAAAAIVAGLAAFAATAALAVTRNDGTRAPRATTCSKSVAAPARINFCGATGNTSSPPVSLCETASRGKTNCHEKEFS